MLVHFRISTHLHLAGRALTSDWSANTFTMVVYQNFFLNFENFKNFSTIIKLFTGKLEVHLINNSALHFISYIPKCTILIFLEILSNVKAKPEGQTSEVN